MASTNRLMEVLRETRVLAREYYKITGKPLGVTGEVAEYEAARCLGIKLAPARQAGYDAVRRTAEGDQRLQIKGRCVLPSSRPGQRLGRVDLSKPWDSVVLVLLDETYEPIEMHEADRAAVTSALQAPGSKARNERGTLSVSKFKAIGERIWPS